MRWLLLLLMAPGWVFAAEMPDSRLLVAKMGGGLLLVILLIVLLAWLLKRLPGLPRNQGVMRVRGTLMLGARERLVLVDVAGEQLLLGVTQGKIELLRQLGRSEAEEGESEPACGEALKSATDASFAQKLQAIMGARTP